MGIFSKKKSTKSETPAKIINLNSVEDLDDLLNQMGAGNPISRRNGKRICPDVLITTHSCYCIPCPKKGTCAFESMAHSAGCIHGFIIYCSHFANEKSKTKGTDNQYKWAEHALKEWSTKLGKMYGIESLGEIDAQLLKKEDTHVKEERRRKQGTVELSGGVTE